MKRLLALLLCVLLTTVLFAACNNDTEQSKAESNVASSAASEAASAEESSKEEINYLDKIYTGSDYDGRTFTFLTSGVGQTATSELVYNEDLSADENFPEIINDAIAERNRKVTDLLGVEIAETYLYDQARHGGTTLTRVRTAISSTDDSFQALSVCLYDCGTLATEGSLYDLTSLKNLNLDNPWWDTFFSETVRIAGKQYFMLGDIGINYKNSTPCVYYNQTLFNKLGLDDPYDLVMSGKWTIDEAIRLSTSYHEDINGTDGISWDDCYGWAGQYDDMYAMLYGSGVRILSPDSDGYPYLTLYSETADNAVTKVLELMLNSEYYVCGNDYFGKTTYQWPMQALEANFIAGRVLFYSGGISTAISLSAMSDTFGILPVPKLNEEQSDYYSLLNTWTTNAYAIALNNTPADAEFAAAVLEAMGYYSWSGLPDSLAVTYYERVLKSQKLTQEESEGMLDFIFARRGCELGSVFQIGKMSGSNTVNDMLSILISNKQVGGFRSAYETYEDVFQNDTDEIVSFFMQ